MSDVQVFLKKYKPVFPTTARSVNLTLPPATNSPEEESSPETPTIEKKPLWRSKSGRVKVLTRTRSMVSTYDFNTDEPECDKGEERGKQGVASAEKLDSEMRKRIERIWPGMEEEEKKHKIVRFQDI